MLLEALREEGAEGRTLLDIGGGVGAVQHALLAAGAPHVINADASPAYQAAMRNEAERSGTAERVEFYLGDFVEMAPALQKADVVTLDRVLCCYPDVEALVGSSAAHTQALWGAVFPREHALSRFGLGLVNAVQRLRGKAFRVHAHSTRTVEAVLGAHGLERRFHSTTLFWQVTVWGRG
jgi:magnesium-protoporphyrin O-methyltransferase